MDRVHKPSDCVVHRPQDSLESTCTTAVAESVYNSGCYLEFEVLTAVIMKSSIFCDVTKCSPLNIN
jgi:hypothetical protein